MLRQGNVIMPRSPAEKRSLMPRCTRQPRRERGESASAHRTHSHSEVSIDRDPDLIMLLSDPEVRLMMHADNVKESQLREMLEAVSVQMQTSRAAHMMRLIARVSGSCCSTQATRYSSADA
jgi:hypothetical protein